MARDEFAALLKDLKERSGLSYGVLAKRLHLSGSTLHRYVSGEAVPTDYAPVERFARLCRATPEESLALHQLWIRADVLRRRKGAEPASNPEPASSPSPSPSPEPASASASASDSEPASGPEPHADAETASPIPPVVSNLPPDAVPGRGRRRRTVALASATVTAAAVAIALIVNLVPGDDGDGERRTEGAAASLSESSGATPDTKRSPTSVSSPPEKSPTTPESTPQSGADASRDAKDEAGDKDSGGATAPTVATDAYKWEDQCSQHYLVNRPPDQVPPPPVEQDARGWALVLNAVPGGDQLLALTVQGTGKQTVVLEALHVRVGTRDTPLPWNDYVMGVGCGGNVSTKSFDVDLDSARPDATPASGQRDFPYRVSESDPEVFLVTAHAQAHSVSWYLELEWSSGKQHGTVRIDDDGKPFRTSGNLDRPAYGYPPGSSEWATAAEG